MKEWDHLCAPSQANPGAIGDNNYTPLVLVKNAGGYIYNAPIVAYNVEDSELAAFCDGSPNYSVVHDKVVSICPQQSTVTLSLTPGFSFARPVLYITGPGQTCGYEVNAFNDPLLALEHFSWHSHDYGIVISDMIMPFMSGLEFIKKVRSANPELVTFVITASDNIKDVDKDILYDLTLLELDDLS